MLYASLKCSKLPESELQKFKPRELYERAEKALRKKKKLGLVANPQYEEALFYYTRAYIAYYNVKKYQIAFEIMNEDILNIYREYGKKISLLFLQQLTIMFCENLIEHEHMGDLQRFDVPLIKYWEENQYERVKKLAAADELEAARLSKSMVEFQMSLLEVMENEIKKKYPEKKLDQYKEHRSDYKKQLSKIIQELQFTSVLYIKAKQSMVGMDLQLTLLREYLVKRGSEHEKAYSLAVEMHKVHSLFKGGNVRIRMILPMAAVILLKTDMKRHEARKALNEIAILSPQFDADWFSFFNYVIEMPHILEYHYETKNKQNKQQLIIKSNPSTPTGSPIQSARNSPTEEKRALANILQATTIQEGHPILKQHLDSMGGKTHSVCDIFSLITNQLEDMQGFEKFVSDSGLMVNDEPVKAIQRSYNFQRCYYDLPVWCRMIIDGRFKNVVDHLEEQQP